MNNTGELLQLSSRLVACTSVADLTSILFPEIEELFDAKGSVLFYVSGRSRHGRFYKPIFRNLLTDPNRAYAKYYHQLDIFTAEVRRRAEAGEIPVCASFEVVGPEDVDEFEKSEYYQDFMRHTGTRHLLLFCIKRGQRPVAIFALHRRPNDEDFTPHDLELAKTLAPFMTSAIDRAHLAEETRNSSHIIDFLSVDVFNRGLLILDEDYGLEMANTRAMEVLENIPDFEPIVSQIPEVILASCQELLDNFGREDTVSRVEFRIDSADGDLPAYVRLKDTGKRRLMFLVFINPREQIAINSEQFKHYKLTPRETEIARSIANGKTDPQIADDLFVSVRTVQNHLRSIYGKAGVRNRTSLIRNLMSVE